MQGLATDLTLLFDRPHRSGAARAWPANASWTALNKKPRASPARARRLLARAAADPTRIVLIRADQPLAQVRADALAAVAALLAAARARA